jgi:UDP-glucose:(heptosyl)LPS alpha-1,3-glucosyltransferase
MSFDHITRQDVFRSGGGPHRLFIQKMAQDRGQWKALWYRISPYHRSLLMIERWQMSAAGSRKIIAVCRQVKREIVDTYRVPDAKVVVIHNGVDQERFHPCRRWKEGREVRDELGIPANRPVVLFVGTGFRRKGLDRLLRLWNDRELEGVFLLVVGNDSRLSSYRSRCNRKETVFVGAQPHVEKYYAAANLFVLPSIQEAFGNVVLEALASGLPVITVAGVGPTDKMEGELKEGILADPDDPIELKSKMLRFLDPARWSSLSQQARQLAEKFSWQRYLDGVENCLGDILAQRRTGEACQRVHTRNVNRHVR